MNPLTRQAAMAHAEAAFPNESCGLVVVVRGKERFWPCRNIAAAPQNHFMLAPEDYAAAETAGEITAIFHSHCNMPAAPSEADRVACEASGLPWVIYALPTGMWAEFEPSGYELPLIGRTHVWNITDCWALVRDWYSREWGIKLLNLARDRDFWKTGIDLLGKNVRNAGFFDVEDGQMLEIGDVLLMQTGDSVVPNHVALYIGDDMILHHAEGRLSSRDVYGGWFRKHTVRIVRHEDRPSSRGTG